jgi:hypothetical protein
MSGSWGRVAFSGSEELELRFGSLGLKVRREENELRTYRILAGEDRKVADPSLLSEPAGWKRWVFDERDPELSVDPRLPRRSIVVAPRDQFHLMSGASARVFVGIPLWIRLQGSGGRELTRLPTRSLTRTWFGTRETGEISYWLRSRFFLSPPPKQDGAATAVVPLSIRNDSGSDLAVEKIHLRMRHFSLYEGEGRFWTDEASIRFEGEEKGSEIRYAGEAPPEAKGATSVAAPDQKAGGSFFARSFFNLFQSGSTA